MLDEITAEALLAEEPAQRIVMLFADAETQAALEDWAIEHGFDLSRSHGASELQPGEFAFHCTLFASANDIRLPLGEWAIDPVTLYATGFDVLGEEADTPVLLVDADGDLVEDRDNIIEETGAEPTFAAWLPHVSLSYAWDGTPDLGALAPPDFPLTFDTIVIGSFDATKGAAPMYNLSIGHAARKNLSRPARRKTLAHEDLAALSPEAAALVDEINRMRAEGSQRMQQVLADAQAYHQQLDTLYDQLDAVLAAAGISGNDLPYQHDADAADYYELGYL